MIYGTLLEQNQKEQLVLTTCSACQQAIELEYKGKQKVIDGFYEDELKVWATRCTCNELYVYFDRHISEIDFNTLNVILNRMDNEL